MILFEDGVGSLPADHVFYSESLGVIAEFVAELNREAMDHPKYFNTNIRMVLDFIMARFESIHDTHAAAKLVHQQYRSTGTQYVLYLRSFSFAGRDLGIHPSGNDTEGPRKDGSGRAQRTRLVRNLGLSSTDRVLRRATQRAVGSRANCLSFVNLHDVYPSRLWDEAPERIAEVSMPSIRVLSHNWRDVVREVIGGANSIVMSLDAETEGTQYELDTICDFGMNGRTIVVARPEPIASLEARSTFRDVIELTSTGPIEETKVEAALSAAIVGLLKDGFVQHREVRDLGDLECYLIDRNIELAASEHDASTLYEVAYEDYVPSSLASNWNSLAETYPEMVSRWRAIEAAWKKTQSPETAALARALQAARATFYLATTLERYREMAMSLATLGLAHRAITGELPVMLDCYQHAAKCSEWARDRESATFYSQALTKLQQEAGG